MVRIGSGRGQLPSADPVRQCPGLWEIRAGQWRGGIWTDPDTGVRWLVVAGVAKGDHQDADDFYVQLDALFRSGREQTLLPTAQDQLMLKRETLNSLVHDWELDLQDRIAETLAILAANTAPIRLPAQHPTKDNCLLATIVIEMAVEPGDEVEEIIVEIDVERRFRGTALAWQMSLRVMTCIDPPAQDWDTGGGLLVTMVEAGHVARQARVLRKLTEQGELCARFRERSVTMRTGNTSLKAASKLRRCGRCVASTLSHTRITKAYQRVLTAMRSTT